MSKIPQTYNHQVVSTQVEEFPPEVQQRIAAASARRNQPIRSPAGFYDNKNSNSSGTHAPHRSQPRADFGDMNPIQQGIQAGVQHQPAPIQPSPRVQTMQQARQQNHGNVSDLQQFSNNDGIDPALLASISGAQQPQHQWYQPPKPEAAPVGEPSIENPRPGFVLPLADSNGTSIMLPSRFAFYGFEDLYVVPFKSGHLAKIQRAHVENSLQPLVEVVSTVIYTSTPGYSNLAWQLTLPDFYFVLYWLRQNSFTKTQYIHTDTCNNPEHIAKVKSKEMHADSLKIKALVTKTSIKTIELEELPDPEVFTLNPESGLKLSPPVMRDVLEFLDDPLMLDPNTRIEFAYLAQQAAHVQGVDGHLTLKQRLNMVENLDLEDVVLIKKYEKFMKGYGIQEKIKVRCKECGASKESALSLDASVFLPSA